MSKVFQPIIRPQIRLPWIFGASCLLLPPVGLLASNGTVPLLFAVTVLSALAFWGTERRLPLPDRTMTVGLAALVLWCAMASFWGFDTTRSLVLTLRIALVFGAGLMLMAIAGRLDDGTRTSMSHWLLAGILIALSLMVSERVLHYPIFARITGLSGEGVDLSPRLNRGATAMALLVWPAVAALWCRGAERTALTLLALVGVILSFLASAAAILGLVCGIIMVGVLLVNRTLGRVLVAAGTVLAFVGTPFVAQQIHDRGWQSAEWLVFSARHRVEIWNYTTGLIERKPWFGWGFDASRAVSDAGLTGEHSGMVLLPLHPHSAPLQVLLELGLVGAVIGLGLLMLVMRAIERLPSPARVCGYALYASTLAIASTAYGLWQNQWLAVMFLAAALFPMTVAAAKFDGAT